MPVLTPKHMIKLRQFHWSLALIFILRNVAVGALWFDTARVKSWNSERAWVLLPLYRSGRYLPSLRRSLGMVREEMMRLPRGHPRFLVKLLGQWADTKVPSFEKSGESLEKVWVFRGSYGELRMSTPCY